MHYSAPALNSAFASSFQKAGWDSSITRYYLTRDPSLLRRCIDLPASEQKQLLTAAGAKMYPSFNQTDFVKDKMVPELDLDRDVGRSPSTCS